MKTSDLNSTFLVDSTPEETLQAILNVHDWWSKGIKGSAGKVNDIFHYRYKDMHESTQKMIELIPARKVVWLVTDSNLTFIDKKDEWNGTKISFEVAAKDGKTEVRFVHYGLTPKSECFEACTQGWDYYVNNSLVQLINTGVGKPEPN